MINTAIVTFVSSCVFSIITYLLTRKKTETDIISTQIANNTKQLDFYIKLVASYKEQAGIYMKKLDSMEKKSDLMEKKNDEVVMEQLRLRRAIGRIVNDVCMVRGCPKRTYLEDDVIKELLGGDSSKPEI